MQLHMTTGWQQHTELSVPMQESTWLVAIGTYDERCRRQIVLTWFGMYMRHMT